MISAQNSNWRRREMSRAAAVKCKFPQLLRCTTSNGLFAILVLTACVFFGANTRGGNLDTTGITLLRAMDPSLTGAGVQVGQPEAQNSGVNDWEVAPALLDGQPGAFFTWINTNGSDTNFPNSLGSYSPHGTEVGTLFYSANEGIAPGVATVNNYEADYHYQFVVLAGAATADQVLNQSFDFIITNVSDQVQLDRDYDNFVASTGALICSGVGNGGPVNPPGTCYNGIGVGAYGFGAASSTGPTPDNGRSKPDLVGPQFETSFSTPYVAGAAVVLLQAALRGDGGTNIAGASD